MTSMPTFPVAPVIKTLRIVSTEPIVSIIFW
jgi:hypothetical protein